MSMKVVKFFSIALAGSFLIASSVLASDVTKSKADVKTAENAIREQVANVLNKVSAEDADYVYVQFAVSANNGFELINVVGSNADLVMNVKTALTSKSITNKVDLEGKYVLKVNFVNR